MHTRGITSERQCCGCACVGEGWRRLVVLQARLHAAQRRTQTRGRWPRRTGQPQPGEESNQGCDVRDVHERLSYSVEG